jgi:hypothetical protein
MFYISYHLGNDDRAESLVKLRMVSNRSDDIERIKPHVLMRCSSKVIGFEITVQVLDAFRCCPDPAGFEHFQEIPLDHPT